MHSVKPGPKRHSYVPVIAHTLRRYGYAVPSSYEGDWANGHMNGFGVYRFADGATYEGVMQDDWPNGEGTARYPNGGVYVGRWKDGKYEVNLA